MSHRDEHGRYLPQQKQIDLATISSPTQNEGVQHGGKDDHLEGLGLRSSLLLLHHRSALLPVPTLLVWGQEDSIIPVRYARRFAHRFPNAQVLILPDCGHWPQMEHAQAFNQAVLAILDSDAVAKDRRQGP